MSAVNGFTVSLWLSSFSKYFLLLILIDETRFRIRLCRLFVRFRVDSCRRNDITKRHEMPKTERKQMQRRGFAESSGRKFP